MKKLIPIILSVLLFSCGKKSDNAAPSGPVNMATKQVVIRDSTIGRSYSATFPALITKYYYNSNNMLTHIVSGNIDTEYKYDSNGLLISIGKPGASEYCVFNYDNTGTITDETRKTYDANSNLTNTFILKYTVNNGLVTSIKSYDNANVLLSTLDLTYDSNGNVTTYLGTDAKTNVKTLSTYKFGTHHSLFFNSRLKFYLSGGSVDLFNKNEIIAAMTDPPPIFNFVPGSYYYTFKGDYQITRSYTQGYILGDKNRTTDDSFYTYANL